MSLIRHLTIFLLAATAAAEELSVTIRVRPASDAYVALVPVWRPASRPLAESITDKNIAVLRVPPGSYELIAGARGFDLTARSITIAPNGRNEAAVELRPLARVSGTVVDADANPIAGARVSTPNGAIPPPLGFVSAMATRHLGAQWSATTDESGAWTLLLPHATVPLLVEAEGHAPEWRHYRPADPAALDVVLKRGAALHLTLDRNDAEMIVTLEREGDASIPVDWQPKVWARRATSSSIEWNSLPAGRYTVYAKYPEPRWFMQRAEAIGTITVPQQQAVRVTLPAARNPVDDAIAAFIEKRTRQELGDVEGDHFVEETIGGTVIHLRADAPLHALTADRFIAIEESGTPRGTSIHPRADAQLHVRSAYEPMLLPQEGNVVLRDCAKGRRVTVPLEIRRDGFSRFTAPADCRSAVLSFQPFEPLLFDAPLRAGEQSLGAFVLRAAASVDVRVMAPDGSVVPHASVRVDAASDESPDRAMLVAAAAVTADDGWARLRGLPIDRLLRVVVEADGRTAMSDAMRLGPRQQVTIDALTLSEPATLIVDAQLSEAFRARFAKARVGTLFVRPADPYRSSEQQQAHVVEGEPLRFQKLAPGRWQLEAVVVVVGAFSLVRLEDVELRSGATQRVKVEVEPHVFSGTITAAGKPVRARITIDDRGRPLLFDSDESGAFHIVLQEPGTYRVDAAPRSRQGNRVPLGEIAFLDPSRPIELKMPESGRVTVRVRNGDRPAAGAVVRASRRDADGSRDVRTSRTWRMDARGEQIVEDLLGVWTFTVIDGRRGAEKTVTVNAGDNATVTLELEGTNAIEGTVRDETGVVLPRARIDCLYLSTGGQPSMAGTSSDGEGAFAIELLAPAAAPALCSVIAPGGAVDAFRANAGRHAEVRAPIATEPAHFEWGERGKRDELWLVAGDGRAISLVAVGSRIGRFGSPLSIPALAAGRWKVVRPESLQQWVALASGLGASLPAVRENVQARVLGGAVLPLFLAWNAVYPASVDLNGAQEFNHGRPHLKDPIGHVEEGEQRRRPSLQLLQQVTARCEEADRRPDGLHLR